MRVAAIDCGTNTIRLLILQWQGGKLKELRREMRIVRLGEGVDASGEFAPAALQRTFEATKEYAEIIAEMAVNKIAFVATSASRDVRNRCAYEAGIREILGVDPQVISGNQEAALAFRGVLSGLHNVEEPVMVVDIGGGSTEFILGGKSGIISSISTDMGSVRLYERYLKDSVKSSYGSLKTTISELSMQIAESENMQPAEDNTPQAVSYAVQKTRLEVKRWLEKANEVVDFSQVRTLVGVAGTVTSITAKALGLEEYDGRLIDGAVLDCSQVVDTCDWMMNATVTKRCELGFMDHYRADVIGAGALIWKEIITFIKEKTANTKHPLVNIHSSEHDILDGIALGMLQEGADE